MNTREAARGRMPKEYFRNYQMSDWVEFDLFDTVAYGKIIDFDKGPDEAIAVISVKAILDPHGEWVQYHDRDEFVEVPVSELSRATESFKVRMHNVASVTQEENPMRTRRTSRAPRSAGRRTAGRFGLHGQPKLRRHPAALNPAAQKMRKLQEALDAGEIDSDEFESQMEQLEAQQRHSYVARKAVARRAARGRKADGDYGDYDREKSEWFGLLTNDSEAYFCGGQYVPGFAELVDLAYWLGGYPPKKKGSKPNFRRFCSTLDNNPHPAAALISNMCQKAQDKAYSGRGSQKPFGYLYDKQVTVVTSIFSSFVQAVLYYDKEWMCDEREASVRTARIEPADVMLLQNAVKQLGKSKDADEAVRMLRDIIDAASEMKKELEPKHTARTAGADDLALLESAIGTLRKTKDEGEKVALLRDIAGAAAEWMKELGS